MLARDSNLLKNVEGGVTSQLRRAAILEAWCAWTAGLRVSECDCGGMDAK